MLIAILILLSIIGCYFALGLAVLASRSLFIADELGPEDFACWPFLLIADGFVLLLSYIRKKLLRSTSLVKGCGPNIPRRIE
jgi:hypothetical protein